MTCRTVDLSGVTAILCTRAKPKRVHFQSGDTSREWPLCGANNCGGGLRVTPTVFKVTCRRCREKLNRNRGPQERIVFLNGGAA